MRAHVSRNEQKVIDFVGLSFKAKIKLNSNNFQVEGQAPVNCALTDLTVY